MDAATVGLFSIGAGLFVNALSGLLKFYKSPKEQTSETDAKLKDLLNKYDELKDKHHELSERATSADVGQAEAVRSLAREVQGLASQVRDLATFVHELIRIRGGT